MNISALLQGAYQPMERTPAIGMGKMLDQANQDFEALRASLSQGDVSSAKTSMNDLKKMLTSAGSIGAANSVKNDFDLLGKALGAGNVSGAQQEMGQLQTDVQAIAQQAQGHSPGLPVRLPGANIYQTGLNAAAGIAKFVA